MTTKERGAVTGRIGLQEHILLQTSDGLIRITLVDYLTTAGGRGTAHRSVLRVEAPVAVPIAMPQNARKMLRRLGAGA